MTTIALLTGTTSGIGYFIESEICKQQSTPFQFIHAVRDASKLAHSPVTPSPVLDLSCKDSIDEYITWLKQTLDNKALSLVVFNAGMKATRRSVPWNGTTLNKCRVVNCISIQYILEQLFNRRMLSPRVKIVFTTSILHWNAVRQPLSSSQKRTGELATAGWANEQYANTKFALFCIAQYWHCRLPQSDIRLVNPGMVSTDIFKDRPGCIRSTRKWFSDRPQTAAKFMVRCMFAQLPEDRTTLSYFTPNEAPLFRVVPSSLQWLQDMIGRRFSRYLFPRTEDIPVPSMHYNRALLSDEDVREQYMRYACIESSSTPTTTQPNS